MAAGLCCQGMALFGIVKQGQTNKPPAMQVVEAALAL